MRAVLPLALMMPIGLAACMSSGAGGEANTAPAAPVTASTVLKDAGGAEKGRVNFSDASGGVMVQAEFMGLPPGPHGFHVHMVGRCDGPDFTSAGGHWNPLGAMHGKDSPTGPHKGDLLNVTIGADGTGHYQGMVPGVTLTGATPMLDADGAAVVVHAGPDDYRTDPAGNSGGRIACGVVAAH